jgi:hypothetical protein
MFIVQFPGSWYLRSSRLGGTATGSVERATRFGTHREAVAALGAAKTLKASARKAARIILIDGEASAEA